MTPLKSELRVEILYRQSTHSWRAVGYGPMLTYGREVCDYGGLQRARRKARNWLKVRLKEQEQPVLFETVLP